MSRSLPQHGSPSVRLYAPITASTSPSFTAASNAGRYVSHKSFWAHLGVKFVANGLRAAVHSIVLRARRDLQIFPVTLQALDVRHAELRREVRVFAVRLLPSAPARVAEQVDIRRPEREALINIAVAVLRSFVVPEPSPMPGYDCDVIMASGSFTFGSSIELSADAPLREPFAAWMQGGVNFNSGRLGAILAAQSMLNAGFLNL